MERGNVEDASSPTADHVPAAIIVMCVTVVAGYMQEHEGNHVAPWP